MKYLLQVDVQLPLILHIHMQSHRDLEILILHRETKSTVCELVDVSGTQYEEIDELREQFDTTKQSNPPKGDYALTQCAAYGQVHPN